MEFAPLTYDKNRSYTLSVIAAVGPHYELGIKNSLLWHIREDLQHFKAITTGHTVIMGSNTFVSLGSKPLPNRENIVLYPDTNPLDKVLQRIAPGVEAFIMGGAMVYAQTVPVADKLYITHVNAPLPESGVDVWFPEIDKTIWEETSREDFACGATFPYPFSFVVYERREPR